MTIQQCLLAGRGLIEPTVPVSGMLFTDGPDTRSYSGNGSNVIMANNSYTIPDNWLEKSYTYSWSISSTASYTCIGYDVRLYKNGSQIASWSTPASQDSYFRYNSGTRSGNMTVSLKAGDVIRAEIYIRGRAVGGSTPAATNYHQCQRVS